MILFWFDLNFIYFNADVARWLDYLNYIIIVVGTISFIHSQLYILR